jgi:sugar phosphate isomerase/epimerase
MKAEVTYSIFTKPWKASDMDLHRLGEFVAKLGFQGIELPVRPGYQVLPESVTRDLPKAAKILAEFKIRIDSVAGPTDEATIAACHAAGVPLIRTMANTGPDGYLAAEKRFQMLFDGLVPLLDRHGVTIGVQNHSEKFVSNACGLRALAGKYDPKHIGVIWDAAHNALNGEEPELALDIVWSHLRMVNLKNAIWRRTNAEPEVAKWEIYWTAGSQGLASWPRVAAELKRRGYSGVVCLPAEYSDEAAVE